MYTVIPKATTKKIIFGKLKKKEKKRNQPWTYNGTLKNEGNTGEQRNKNMREKQNKEHHGTGNSHPNKNYMICN